jgi:hypothetical protein
LNFPVTLLLRTDLTSIVRTSKVATPVRKPRVLREYKDAVAEQRLLSSYLKAATRVLPKPERGLLAEFAQISKRKCQRLRKALDQKSNKNRSAA